MTNPFISEAEFRAAAPELDLSRYTPTTISGILTRATVIAESYLDYSLAFETKQEKAQAIVDQNGDILIFPKKKPVHALNSVVLKKGRFTTNITITSNDEQLYDIIDDHRIVISSAQVSLQSISIIDYEALRRDTFFLDVSYDAGFHMYDRPQDLVEAVILIARDLFSRSSNTSGASEISQGGVTIKYASTKGKSEFQKDAESILDNYTIVSGF